MDGMFEISNIRIGGFSGIHRTGECSLTTTLQGVDVVIDFGKLKIQLHLFTNHFAIFVIMMLFLGSNDILLGVDISFGAGILRANIGLELVVSHVSLMVNVRVAGTGISLRDFKLNEIGYVHRNHLNVDGYSFFSFPGEWLSISKAFPWAVRAFLIC